MPPNDLTSAQFGASLADLNTTLKLGNQNISALIQAIYAIFPRVTGSFTLGAAASTTVLQSATKANSIPLLIPTNAAAGTLMGGTKSLYVSARVAGTSFTVSTASGVAAVGTEQFSYILVNPS